MTEGRTSKAGGAPQATEMAKANPLGYEKIGKLIFRFSMPAILSNLVNAIHNIVDQIYIGHGIGTAGIAATNIAFPLVTITTSIALLVGVGASTAFNLNLGAGHTKKAEKLAGNGIVLCAVCGFIVSVLSCMFMTPILKAFGANAEIIDLAREYTFIIALGFPFQVLTVGLCQLIRSDGSPNWASGSMMAGAIFNIIFDYVFMFGFGWGIKGIGWATTLGQVLASSLASLYLIRGLKSIKLTKDAFKLSPPIIKEICSLGIAGFVNQISQSIVQITLNNTLRHYGELSRYGSTIPLAAVGAIGKIGVFYIMCNVGVGQGCQPIYGFNYGAKNYARVKETLKMAISCMMVISLLFFTALQLFPRQIISVFGQGSEAYYDFAVRYIRIAMFMTIVNGFQPAGSGYFTSTGRVMKGMFITMTRQLIFLLPLLLILPYFFGIDGVVFAAPTADSISAVISIWMIRSEMKRLDGLIAT